MAFQMVKVAFLKACCHGFFKWLRWHFKWPKWHSNGKSSIPNCKRGIANDISGISNDKSGISNVKNGISNHKSGISNGLPWFLKDLPWYFKWPRWHFKWQKQDFKWSKWHLSLSNDFKLILKWPCIQNVIHHNVKNVYKKINTCDFKGPTVYIFYSLPMTSRLSDCFSTFQQKTICVQVSTLSSFDIKKFFKIRKNSFSSRAF